MAEGYTDSRYRPRLAIPRNDLQTMEWIKTQGDLSASVRRLIREAIARYGMVDVDCLPVRPGVHPGRPRKTVETVSDEDGLTEPEIDEEVSGVGTAP